MAPVADKLVADVARLDAEIPGLELEPAQIANGAVDLLNEVSTSKITGEEDRYSHTDLWDFEANVLGAQAAFDAVQADRGVAVTPSSRRRSRPTSPPCSRPWTPYRQGDGFVTYDQLTKADTRKLAAVGRHARRRAGQGAAGRRRCRGSRSWLAASPGAGSSVPASGRGRSASGVRSLARSAAAGRRGTGTRRRSSRSTASTRPASTPRCSSASSTARSISRGSDRSELRRAPPATGPTPRRCSPPGEPVGPVEPDNAEAAPDDTGEATGLLAGRPHDHGRPRPERVRRSRRERPHGPRRGCPPPLVEMPSFRGDVLDPFQSDGDLSVQCCSDDPQVAFHAFHNLARIATARRDGAVDPARVRPDVDHDQPTATTPRNLMGFKDGTNNITSDDTAAMDADVWVARRRRPRVDAGGSYVVVRRIRMLLESWDRTSLREQERVIGRTKVVGAPHGSTPRARDAHGSRRRMPTARPSSTPTRTSGSRRRARTGDRRILRRGYSFSDGIDQRTAELDAGLFFIAYQRDPRAQFIPLQDEPRPRPTRSTSTSSTSAAGCSRCSRACDPAGTSARRCSRDRARASRPARR